MRREDVLALYQGRLQERERETAARKRKVDFVSYARLATFVAGVFFLWFVWERARESWPLLAVPLVLFVVLLFVHARFHDALTRAERAARFYRRGIERIEGSWQGKGRSGEVFLDRDHPYARDLDVFGKGSLFELLATTVTSWGASTLARWLKEPATLDEVHLRQEAVKELWPLVDLRERVASEPAEGHEATDSEALEKWASSPPLFASLAGRWAAFVLGLATTVLAILWLASRVDRVVFLASLAVSASFALFFRGRTTAVLAAAEAPSRDLSLLASFLAIFESQSFRARHLVSLQGRLTGDGEPASSSIRRLAKLIEFLDARRNQLFAPLAALLLWGTQFAFAIESWRAASGRRVPRWLEAVGELDALLALGSYGFENPDDVFPTTTEERAVLEAEGLGHPLIPPDRLVRNDVALGGLPEKPRLMVVSGSNMSGKSTLLRSLGVNAVLALAGAPVRARRLNLSRLRVAASIHVEDSLQDGISHFYAEILRLRQVMELAKGDVPVLFLLDEILHGTNSHDRRIGAEAVVRGLVDRGAIGLVTTHDLALSKLEETLSGRAKNVHFEDHLEDGKIRFDYRMRDGIVKKSNALELMRGIGLEV
ncbi:MAG TPA: DNA mismatch repair protein MutS [Vicinamibacteria bacterium]|nr:DNA mismatch repair protein MutS [Vicinamibacteria bacterium]